MKSFWAVTIAILSLAMVWTGTASAQQYRLQTGDVLRVEVLEDPSLNRDVLISPDGRISFPLVGNVRAGGRTLEQVQSTLTAALQDDFAVMPNVFVGLSSVAQRSAAEEPEAVVYDIYILGEVGNPGLIQVEPGTTILQVFALAGGFSDFAATKRIQLRRGAGQGSQQIYPLNYEKIESGLSNNGQVRVADGDTFVVPTRRLFE